MSVRTLALGSVAALLMGASAGALAADLPARAAAPAPLAPAPVFTWTGFYVGLNAGMAGNEFRYPFGGCIGCGEESVSYDGRARMNANGFLGGAQIGYNWQFGNGFLVGLEADYAFANIDGRLNLDAGLSNGDDSIGLGAGIGGELTSLGTVRARLGWAAFDRTLLYVTGGWAWGRMKNQITLALDGTEEFSFNRNVNMSGWTLGAGLEYAVTPNMSLKTEYLYVDLGDKTIYSRDYGFATANLKVDTRLHVLRAGLNWRFWSPAPVIAGPVLARY
jgi:outer membrane immunogenic protein